MRVKWIAAALLLALGGWEPFRTTDDDVDDGNTAAAQGHYDEAVKDYERARGRVDDGGLDYDVGTAKLKAAAAAKDAATKQKLRDDGLADLAKAAARAKDPQVRAQASYNRGNAYFADDKLDEAVKEYKDALKTNPDFEDARLNLELALRHRKKEQQQQQQQNGQGQGQQGQGQQGQNQQGQGQGQRGQNQQGQGQGQNPQGPQGQGSNQQNPPQGQGSGSNPQNPPQGQGSGSNQQNQQGQGQGSQDPNQQAPRPKLPNGQQGSGSSGQEKTPDDSNLDQLEGESRDQRRNQARRRSDETYHPAETEDW